MDSSVLLYVEVDLLSFIIMLVMIINMWQTHHDAFEDKYFFQCLITVEIVLISDMLVALVQGIPGQFVFFLMYFLNMIYFAFSAVACYLWLVYIDANITESKRVVMARKPMYTIPAIAIVVLTLASAKTGWIFYIDQFNVYHRGELHMLQRLSAIIYFVCAILYSSTELYKSKNSQTRMLKCKQMLGFSFVPLFGTVVQAIIPDMVLIWPVTCVGMFIAFANLQNSQIFIDSLTGINNTSRFAHYIKDRVDKIEQGDVMTCILIDVDEFKAINDRYGHRVGDQCLIDVANILKRVCQKVNSSNFIARFGADEFVIVSYDYGVDHTEEIKKIITEEVEALNENGTRKFRLSLSMGASRFDAGNMTHDDLLRVASDAMFEEKMGKKESRKAAKEASASREFVD